MTNRTKTEVVSMTIIRLTFALLPGLCHSLFIAERFQLFHDSNQHILIFIVIAGVMAAFDDESECHPYVIHCCAF